MHSGSYRRMHRGSYSSHFLEGPYHTGQLLQAIWRQQGIQQAKGIVGYCTVIVSITGRTSLGN